MRALPRPRMITPSLGLGVRSAAMVSASRCEDGTLFFPIEFFLKDFFQWNFNEVRFQEILFGDYSCVYPNCLACYHHFFFMIELRGRVFGWSPSLVILICSIFTHCLSRVCPFDCVIPKGTLFIFMHL